MTTKRRITKRELQKSGAVQALSLLNELIDEPMTFGSALAAYREGEEWTQAILAEKLDISRQHVCDYEKGRRLPPVALAWKYAEILGLSGSVFAQLVVREQLAKEGIFVKVRLERDTKSVA